DTPFRSGTTPIRRSVEVSVRGLDGGTGLHSANSIDDGEVSHVLCLGAHRQAEGDRCDCESQLERRFFHRDVLFKSAATRHRQIVEFGARGQSKVHGPLRGDYFVTTNCGLLLSIPDGVITETVPVLAPAGTVAWM